VSGAAMVIAGVVIETTPGAQARVAARLVSVPGLTLQGGDGVRRIAAVIEGLSGETLEELVQGLVARDEEILGVFPTLVGHGDDGDPR